MKAGLLKVFPLPLQVKIDELQAVLSQPDRMPVLPDPENVIDLTLDSDDGESDDGKKCGAAVVLANAQEKMRVLQVSKPFGFTGSALWVSSIIDHNKPTRVKWLNCKV